MNENDKAAIAAGLWEPGRRCGPSWNIGCTHKQRLYGDHDIPAPDMYDPANICRAIENRKLDVGFRDGRYFCDGEILNKDYPFNEVNCYGANLVDAVRATLVALYDAEHPA